MRRFRLLPLALILASLPLLAAAPVGDPPNIPPPATPRDRLANVTAAMATNQIDWAGYAVYDQQGRPVMTPDGRHQVRIVPIDTTTGAPL